jgi:hypothetical protein
MIKTITPDNTVLLQSLNAQRTRMLDSYLELLELRLQQAAELGIEDTLDLRTIHLNLGRRSGSSTWVKEMLLKYEYSAVICTLDLKEKFYKLPHAVDTDSVIMHPPLSWTDHLVFFDIPLPLEDKSKINKYIQRCRAAKALIIVS